MDDGLSIHAQDEPQVMAFVADMSETGLKVKNLRIQDGETKRFVIPEAIP